MRRTLQTHVATAAAAWLALSLGLSEARAQQTFQSDLAVTAHLSRKIAQDTNVRQAAYVLAARASTDSDGYALAPAPTAGTTVTGGGLVPTSSGAPRTDGFGRNLGYCAWDNGTSTGAAGYIAGSNSLAAVALAVVSPGADNIFSTTCAQIAAGQAASGDDFYVAYTSGQVLAGVQGTTYFADPVNTVAELSSIAASALQNGQVRLVRATNQLYRYNSGTTSWQLLTGGQWVDAAVAGDIYYNAGNVAIGSTAAQRRLTVTSNAVPVGIASTGNRNGIDALNAVSNAVNAFFGFDTAANQVRVEALNAGSSIVLSTGGGTVSVSSAGVLNAPQGISSGAISATTLTTSGAITTSAIQSSGPMSITATALTLAAPTTVSGALTASSGLTSTTGTFSGALAANGGLTGTTGTFSGTLAANGGLTSTTGTFSGNVAVGGTLTATGGLNSPSGYFGTDTTNRVIHSRNSAVQLKGSTSASHDLGMVAWRTDTTGPAIMLSKGNSATAGTMTAVATASQLGALTFGGADGTALSIGSYLQSHSTQAWSGTARGSNMTLYVTPNNSTTQTIAQRWNQDSSVDLFGNISTTGGITATTGTYSGALAANGGLSATTGTFSGVLAANGGLTATTGSFSGALTGTTGTFSGALTANGGLTATTGTFSGALAANGGLTATTGSFSSTLGVTGLLTASGGLSATTGTFSGTLAANGGLTANTATVTSAGAALTIQSTSAAAAQLILKDTGTTNNLIIGSAGQSMTFQTGGSERMRIDGSGNVGIGRTPTNKLDVQGASMAFWDATAANYISFAPNANGRINGSNILSLQTAGVDRMVIDNNGYSLFGNDLTARAYSGSASRIPAIQVKGTGTNPGEIVAQTWGTTGVAGGTIHLYRGYSTTPGTMTAMASGQQLGAVIFGGTDGTLNSFSSYIASNSTQAWSGTARGSNLQFATTPNNSTTQTVSMVLDQDGVLLAGNDMTARSFAGTSGALQVKGTTPSTATIQAQAWTTSNYGGNLHLSRGHGAPGTTTALPNGQVLGTVLFGGTNGSLTDWGTGMQATTTQQWSPTAMGSALSFFTTPNNGTSKVTAMAFDHDGTVIVPQNGGVNVGINSTSLGFNAANESFAQFGVNLPVYGLAWKFFSDATGAPSAGLSGWNGVRFYTTGGERMRIGSDGYVGINRIAAGYMLDINGGVRATSYTTASDARLKHDVSTIDGNGLMGRFMSVRPVIYTMNDSNARNYGYIAQELRPLFPEMVMQDTEGYLGVQYTQMIPVLTAIAQQQQRQLQDLERRKIDNTVDKWIESSDQKARMYFERDGKTVLRGHGAIALELRDDADRAVARFRRGGDVDLFGMVNMQSERGGFAFNPTGTIVSSTTPGEIIVNSSRTMRAAVRLQHGTDGQAADQVFGLLFGDANGVGLADGAGKTLLQASTGPNGASSVKVLATLTIGDGKSSRVEMAGGTAIGAGADGGLQLEATGGVRVYNPATKEAVINLGSDGTVQARRFEPTEVVQSYASCDGHVGAIARDANGTPMVCAK